MLERNVPVAQSAGCLGEANVRVRVWQVGGQPGLHPSFPILDLLLNGRQGQIALPAETFFERRSFPDLLGEVGSDCLKSRAVCRRPPSILERLADDQNNGDHPKDRRPPPADEAIEVSRDAGRTDDGQEDRQVPFDQHSAHGAIVCRIGWATGVTTATETRPTETRPPRRPRKGRLVSRSRFNLKVPVRARLEERGRLARLAAFR